MTPFEYLMVMVSIILGLGITTILTGVAEMIKRTKLTSLFTPYIIWIVLVFVIHIHEWLVSYELKTVQVWELYKFILILLYPINLYILAHLLFPTGQQREFTAREFYFSSYPKLFVTTIILDVQSIIYNLTLGRQPIHTQVPHLIVLIVLSTMVTAKTKNAMIHTAVAVALLLILIASLWFENRKIY